MRRQDADSHYLASLYGLAEGQFQNSGKKVEFSQGINWGV